MGYDSHARRHSGSDEEHAEAGSDEELAGDGLAGDGVQGESSESPPSDLSDLSGIF
jgi:hypothetical protein